MLPTRHSSSTGRAHAAPVSFFDRRCHQPKGAAMARSRATANKSSDAIAMLKADHDKVKKLFKEFERMHDAGSEQDAEHLATQICKELTVHTTLEEEVFYPEVR